MSEDAVFQSVLSELRDQPDRLIEIARDQGKMIEQLRAENAALRAEIARLKKDNDDLNGRLEQVERQMFRQAAPFRIEDNKRKAQPRKPGRAKGHPGAYRRPPEQVDETIKVPLPTCPHCGGPVERVRPVEQFIEDVPPVRPHVTRLVTYRGRCRQCGRVRSGHPLQVSTATAAAGTHLGPNALALATELLYRYKMTRRTVSDLLHRVFGLSVTPGGLVQLGHRMAGKAKPFYDGLLHGLRHALAVHCDETSWYVGGPNAWLWVFTNRDATVYAVRHTRGRVVVHEQLGLDFPGVLVSDCLSVYDDATTIQHKCYAHHLKAIRQAIKQHPRGGEGFLKNMRALLHAAMALKTARGDLPPRQFAATRGRLERSADQLLAQAGLDPHEQSVANRLRKQRDHLFTFLDHDAVDATNNLAERQLRPAVISRKVSCGNRTDRGARTWEILASLAATCSQCGESFRHLIANTARLPPPQPSR